MGRVYEARHTRLHTKRFAVKLLHHELARQPEVVTRFQREAEAASVLTHPNVVGVYDVNTSADGRPYIVAEMLEGEELGNYLERLGKLPVVEAVHIVRQVCRALGAAHAHGIVHRDVKPENVFLAGPSATVKVLDFGISKVAENSDGLTKTGTVMGTPDYMAPEQARGDRVDARADIYAVGAILYRALTGRKPFDGMDPMAILTAVLTQEPERPSTLEPSIPLSLELIVQRTMAKSPAERFATMEALEQALAVELQPAGLLPGRHVAAKAIGLLGRHGVVSLDAHLGSGRRDVVDQVVGERVVVVDQQNRHYLASARSIAASSAASLFRHSWCSAAGSESTTMPPPAWRYARPFRRSTVRMAMQVSSATPGRL